MFLYSNDSVKMKGVPITSKQNGLLQKRKVIFSPPIYLLFQSIRTFFFAPLRAALTVEAAIVLPIFLFFMIGALQYAAVMETAVKLGTSLAETGKTMGMAAYVSRYGGDAGKAAEVAVGALSAVYAQKTVTDQAGDTSEIKNVNMALSSFLAEDESIDLVMTYQIRSPFGMVKLPGTFFIQRAKVRAWTGRIPPKKKEEQEDEEGDTSTEMVYMTETGSVYHNDPECTHLKLSVTPVSADSVFDRRNSHGGIYHACEKCGSAPHGDTLYITKEGNRYHTTLECSGLKRTVRQVPKSEAEHLWPCTRCGKK